jgi:hybrid cluster-associated redox disulfide protein
MNRTQPITAVTANCLVYEVIERHPQAIRVFVRHGLQCPGCYIAPYHTITDTAREYALGVELLLDDLNRAIGAQAG